MITAIMRAILKLADDSTSALTAQIVDLEADDADDIDIDVMEPVGVHFMPSADEEMLVFEVNDDGANRVVMGASQRGHRPQDLTDAGTGGLHFLGEWKVFLDADGSVHLGKRDPSDFVALKSLVDAEIARFYDTVANWVPGAVAMDGGANVAVTLKAAFATAKTAVQSTGSTTVKAE